MRLAVTCCIALRAFPTWAVPSRAQGPEAGVANAPPTPPADWQGVGILAKRADKLPRGAPSWAAIAAEVIERDGKRFLRATGKVDDIDSVALARSTAENRARAEMTRWLGVTSLQGALLVNLWQRKKSHVFLAQVEVALPPEALAPLSK